MRPCLQPHVAEAATARGRGCNRTWQVRAKSPRSGRAETAQLLRAVEEAAVAGVGGEVMKEAREVLRGTLTLRLTRTLTLPLRLPLPLPLPLPLL